MERRVLGHDVRLQRRQIGMAIMLRPRREDEQQHRDESMQTGCFELQILQSQRPGSQLRYIISTSLDRKD